MVGDDSQRAVLGLHFSRHRQAVGIFQSSSERERGTKAFPQAESRVGAAPNWDLEKPYPRIAALGWVWYSFCLQWYSGTLRCSLTRCGLEEPRTLLQSG